MLFNLNPGHTLSGGDVGTRGINGLKEEVLTRQLVWEIDKELRCRAHSIGFRNREIKDQPLALTKSTKPKTIYIEVCLIDSSGDVAILNKYGMNGIAKAIVNGVLGSNVTSTPSQPSNNIGWINLDGKTGTINTPSGVKVREKKSTFSRILEALPNGSKVQLYRKEGDWIHIYYPPHGGYVYGKYVRY
ncbi:SH3 domain-containing protein [Clostridium sporogenes]|uniref:SH3 domain-containing protein n=1 Tax=Clostridium TaxID=1485 RepID=UPI0006B28864|nr:MULTISPECIES: SH3 domain-containing protein [Clostridium]STC75786.1 N-acetylmuramoyl-L-alanine amidase [Clostridium botulinum]KOY65155.1 N-acetylmuramoyl-L-alanine amidase [Clostridium sporogenes]KYN78167.1 N-acetylmuramoyl-L-alanine amidase [Clostridium sporogenes]MBA4509377.1 SH3 domain-containing protein [Clostridium sporogenes]MBE6057057.1 hypothetical protein [Clostridium sp.]